METDHKYENMPVKGNKYSGLTLTLILLAISFVFSFLNFSILLMPCMLWLVLLMPGVLTVAIMGRKEDIISNKRAAFMGGVTGFFSGLLTSFWAYGLLYIGSHAILSMDDSMARDFFVKNSEAIYLFIALVPVTVNTIGSALGGIIATKVLKGQIGGKKPVTG